MNSHILSSLGDIISAVLHNLVPVAVISVTHHSLHTQLLHTLPKVKISWNQIHPPKCLLGFEAEVDSQLRLKIKVVEAECEGPAGSTEDGGHNVDLGGQVVESAKVDLFYLKVGSSFNQQSLGNIG